MDFNEFNMDSLSYVKSQLSLGLGIGNKLDETYFELGQSLLIFGMFIGALKKMLLRIACKFGVSLP